MKLAWATDIHLNFVELARFEVFCHDLSSTGPDAVVIAGDIGESDDLVDWLGRLDAALPCPIYFVLGNHDFYGGRIDEVRRKVISMVASSQRLNYLSDGPVVALTGTTALIGHDGWGDARLGDYCNTTVFLNDFIRIRDFSGLDRAALRTALEAQGDLAAAFLRARLAEALPRYRQLIVVTHVPPWIEACWHDGKTSDDNWAPFFTCQAVGAVLEQAMRSHSECQMTVLCGHTHGGGEAQILPNLRVFTGGAVYHEPEVQRVIDVA